MNLKRNLLAAALALALPAAMGAQTVLAAGAPVGVQLLTNPGHEHPGVYYGGRGEINVTWNWVGYWQESPPGVDPRDQSYRTPEFRPPFARDYPYRVNSGGGSDRWFNYFALNKNAGILQEVDGLQPGSPVRFSTWISLWSSNDNDPAIPPKSSRDGNMQVRVCIDQDGGVRNMLDPELKCSPWYQPYDQWYQISVDAVAKSSKVTALIHSRASIPVEHNDAYADDSCFEVLPKAGNPGICLGHGYIDTGAASGAAQVSPKPPLANVDPTDETLKQVSASAAFDPAAVRRPVAAGSATGKAVASLVPVLNVRQSPSLDGGILSSLASGLSLPFLGDASAEWRKVSFNGIEAFVYAALSSVIDAPAAAPAATPLSVPSSVAAPAGDKPMLAGNVAAGLNVRADFSLDGQIVGVLAQGAPAEVTGKSADGLWYKVLVNGTEGYVYAALTVPNAAALAIK